MENVLNTSPTLISRKQQQINPTPASTAVAAAAASNASSSLHKHKLTSSFSSRQPPPISLNTVINSQFENEAETHILAALEMEETEKEIKSSVLLGEGLDELEDYSDDDEDGEDGVDEGGHARSQTWNNDSFLRKVNMQNELPQYQQQHHRYLSSSRGSGYLPSVPDDAALEYDAESLARHIQNSDQEGDDPFLEGARRASTSDDGMGDATNHQDEYQRKHSNRSNGKGEDTNGQDSEDTEHHTATSNNDVNTLTDTTETTGNMNFMAQRLRSLQRKRNSLRRSFLASDGGSSHDDAAPVGGEYEDRLINALNSVDSSKNKSFVRKLRSEYHELIVPKLPTFYKNISHTLLFVIFPSLSVAALLFYMLDNPMAGESGTSISWWILFLGVRQVLMFESTRVGEVFWVEIVALRSKIFNMAVGPYVSLALIQSKGWPYILCFWAILDFAFLFGTGEFPKHWLFYQNKLDLFNAANPVVGITDNETYMRLLLSLIFIGVATSLKRLWLAIYLGRRTVRHFGSELETLMAKMILIGEVANLAKDIENKQSLFANGGLSPLNALGEDEKLGRFRDFMMDENSSTEASPSPRMVQRKVLEVPSPNSAGSSSPKISPGTGGSQGASPAPGRSRSQTGNSPPRPSPRSPMDTSTGTPRPRSPMDPSTGNAKPMETDSTTNVKLMYLLSEWEEPELTAGKNSKATVRDLVQFRKAASYMDDKYPFSHAFGLAKTRELCVQSSQEVYDRLMLSAIDAPALPFSILSVLAMDEKDEFIPAKIKSYIRLFRPDRQGNLSRLDFVKSVDTVYKQLRLLRASISNSAQIDLAFERIVNWFFNFFLAVIVVSILGIKIWTVFLSLNTFLLGFSFLFGSAASNYFEGLLLIFVRRPYDIGDKIATSNPNKDTDSNGSSTWFVDEVTLFTTTVRFATTNEVATYSNGSLAVLRIINANRSPKAIVSILIKFGLETPFNKITVFRTAVENFIKARPREWIALAGFRATRVEADFGYVEYKIVAQHRESWQNVGPVLQSKADLSSFCLEATKKLKLKYESPPMPVNLSTSGNLDISGIFHKEDNEPKGDIIEPGHGDGKKNKSISAEDLQEVANLFEIRKKAK